MPRMCTPLHRRGPDGDTVAAGARARSRVRLAALGLVVASALTVAACGSSGVHAKSVKPAPSGSSRTASPTTADPSASVRPSTHPPSSRVPPSIPTPTVVPAAQVAVDRYMQMYVLLFAIGRDPAHADLSKLNQYLTGQALRDTVSGFVAMKQSGLAYRGGLPDPRLKVVSAYPGESVVLSSCPTNSATDPLEEYVVATGKALPAKTTPPLPPYKRAVIMQQVGGQWKESTIAVDGSKTCTADTRTAVGAWPQPWSACSPYCCGFSSAHRLRAPRLTVVDAIPISIPPALSPSSAQVPAADRRPEALALAAVAARTVCRMACVITLIRRRAAHRARRVMLRRARRGSTI